MDFIIIYVGSRVAKVNKYNRWALKSRQVIWLKEHVLQFQITVNVADVMQRLQTVYNLQAYLNGSFLCELAMTDFIF